MWQAFCMRWCCKHHGQQEGLHPSYTHITRPTTNLHRALACWWLWLQVSWVFAEAPDRQLR
jgi:hypothetical protein